MPASGRPPSNPTDGSVLTNGRLVTPTAPAGTASPPTVVAGTTYAVTAGYAPGLASDGLQSDLCSSGQPPSQSHPGVISLQVIVSWDGGAAGHSVTVTTDINYPKPGLQTEGFLAINVQNDQETDVNGNTAEVRLLAVPVTVTPEGNPSGALTLYPDKNGCIFAQVPVGTYDVAALQPTAGSPPTFTDYSGAPPFVTTSGSTTNQQNAEAVTVTAETVVNLPLFDEGINSSISYGGATAVDSGVDCPNAAAIRCITTGEGPTGGTAAWGGGSSTWNSTTLPVGSQLNQVDCTTAAAAECVGVGYGSTGGLIATTSSDANSLSYDTVPAGVTDLTQAVCLSTNGCYATGQSTTGPVLLAGRVGPGPDTWVVVPHPGLTFAALNSIACPTATTCELTFTAAAAAPAILRLDGDPGTLASNPLWTPVETTDILPAAVRSVGTITCPTTTTCLATATGDQASPSDATVITVPVAPAGASTWTAESLFPTGASTVSGLSCTATTCVAIGTATAAAAVWTGNLTTAPHGWSQATGFPSNVLAVTGVACGNPAAGDTADCAVAATTAGASGGGELIDGSLSGSWAWNAASIPVNENLQYVIGVSCMTPAAPGSATCAAVGATPGGPVVLATSTGPAGTWTAQTPNTLTGQVVTGIPLETAPAGTTAWTTQVAAGGTPNASTLPYILYPQPPGYSIVAGDCQASYQGVSAAIANLNAAPGGTAQVTVPLGLMPLQLVGPTGAPVGGATITLTSTACGSADSYNLPPTDATGVTVASIPYGTYSYMVTQGTSAVAHTSYAITLGASTVTVVNGGSTLTDYLPGTVQVPA